MCSKGSGKPCQAPATYIQAPNLVAPLDGFTTGNIKAEKLARASIFELSYRVVYERLCLSKKANANATSYRFQGRRGLRKGAASRYSDTLRSWNRETTFKQD